MHGADLDTLKSICSSLERCAGFNSDGWMKGRIVGKKRSELNLYLKQAVSKSTAVPRGNGTSAPMTDAAAGVFASHMMEYARMEKDLKMYPNSPNR